MLVRQNGCSIYIALGRALRTRYKRKRAMNDGVLKTQERHIQIGQKDRSTHYSLKRLPIYELNMSKARIVPEKLILGLK